MSIKQGQGSPGRRHFILLILCLLLLSSPALSSSALGADWPMWRFDAGRSAASPEQLPGQLHLQWVRQHGATHVAWAEDVRLQFDASLQPVAVGKTLLIASSRNDSLTAFDTETGAQRWQFFAEGPIRFAPIVWKEKVLFGSDDGNFYCLDVADGKMVWKYRGAPAERRAIGNERLISVWPMRGGPVLQDGNIHFTFGFWPFEGAFLITLDAETGKVKSNETLSRISPQGYLAIGDGKLFIPCGREKVHCRDLATGKAVSMSYDSRGKTDFHATAQGKWLMHGDRIYDVASKNFPSTAVHRPVSDAGGVYGDIKGGILAYGLKDLKTIDGVDRRGKKIKTQVLTLSWSITPQDLMAATKQKNAGNPLVHIKAGNRLYAHHGKRVFAVDLPEAGGKASISWSADVEGTPSSMIAADGKLFVTTKEGAVYCFGGSEKAVKKYPAASSKLADESDIWSRRVADILSKNRDKGGYCLALGIGTGRLIEELVRQSEMQVIVIDSDQNKIAALRKQYNSQGLYGPRVVAHLTNRQSFSMPPYLANLIVSEDAANLPAIKNIFQALRPYGGTAYLSLTDAQHAVFVGQVEQAKLAKAEIKRTKHATQLTRVGELPGAANWTHEYGDAANTLTSRDRLVKAPLGVLWYGGPASSGELFFNRHYWGPSLTVINGRMFIQGPKIFTAVDIYTGRILWKVPLPDKASPGRRGNFFEKVRVGFHYVAVDDAIYISDGESCKRIDPTTGETVATFEQPVKGGRWGRMRIWEDLLISAVFRKNEQGFEVPKDLVALDRHTGELKWKIETNSSAPLVAIGGGKVFYFDGLIEGFYDAWKRKGLVPKAGDFRYLKAADARTGKPLWERTTGRVVTWLGYSEEHDVLLASNRNGMEAATGSDGKELWKKESTGKGFLGHPENLWDKVILLDNRIIDQRGPGMSYDIKTGKSLTYDNPITGKTVTWEFTKTGHHCNYAIASPNMVTFRAASAGFLDLESNTSSRLEGFRSGCRNSLIPAGGVLNAPNFAHGCVCSYSTFTSLALVNVPEVELWTYSAYKQADTVSRVGINLGAPGDRLADSGTMWLDYPNVGGPSPNVPVRLIAKAPHYFRHHATQISGEGLAWVAASGCEGLSVLNIQLSKDAKKRKYKVRLFFAEPKAEKAGERVFDVSVQGAKVLEDFDVFQEAGGANRMIVKETSLIEASGQLQIVFTAKAGLPLLCGVEVIAEKD